MNADIFLQRDQPWIWIPFPSHKYYQLNVSALVAKLHHLCTRASYSCQGPRICNNHWDQRPLKSPGPTLQSLYTGYKDPFLRYSYSIPPSVENLSDIPDFLKGFIPDKLLSCLYSTLLSGILGLLCYQCKLDKLLNVKGKLSFVNMRLHKGENHFEQKIFQ